MSGSLKIVPLPALAEPPGGCTSSELCKRGRLDPHFALWLLFANILARSMSSIARQFCSTYRPSGIDTARTDSLCLRNIMYVAVEAHTNTGNTDSC